MVHSHIINTLILVSSFASLAITPPRGFCGEELTKDPSIDFHETLDYCLSHSYRAEVTKINNKLPIFICGKLVPDYGSFNRPTRERALTCLTIEF
jgi:hypothetical protein